MNGNVLICPPYWQIPTLLPNSMYSQRPSHGVRSRQSGNGLRVNYRVRGGMKPDSSVHLFNAEDVLMIGDTSDRPAERHEKLGSVIRMSRKIRAAAEALSMKTGDYRIPLRSTPGQVRT